MDTRYASASFIRVGPSHDEGAVGAVTGAAPLQCRACGVRYDESTWRGLVLVRRIDQGEVQRHIMGWPDGSSLEARRCGGCNNAVAARVSEASPSRVPRARLVGLAPAQLLEVRDVLPCSAKSGASGVR